jgi:hypothetical protein
MATAKSASLKRAGNQAARKARRATTGGWIEGLERWGYVARGVLYIIMGALALQLALGSGGKTTDPVGALRYIAGQPYGRVLMAAIVVGLAGYSLWGFARGLFDALDKGSDAKGLAQRVGYLVSAISYGLLILPAYQLLTTRAATSQQTGSPGDVTAQLMAKPNGLGLVYLFGLFWVVASISQLVFAMTASFMHDLKTSRMTTNERYWVKLIGRIGYAARGVVYGELAVFILRAASTANPQPAQGIDGALIKLARGSYGQIVLGSVAAGLVLFGIFSVLSARWYSIEQAAR